MLKPGQKYYSVRFRTCTALRVGKECKYAHAPQVEPPQEPQEEPPQEPQQEPPQE